MMTVVSDVAICERIVKVIHNVLLCCEHTGMFATLCVIAQAFWSKSSCILDARNLIVPVSGCMVALLQTSFHARMEKLQRNFHAIICKTVPWAEMEIQTKMHRAHCALLFTLKSDMLQQKV